MERLQAIQFLEQNKDYFFPNTLYTDMQLENMLVDARDDFSSTMYSLRFYKPGIVQLISLTGFDRIYMKDKKGILKYLTLGGLGIWQLADILTAKKRCRNKNCKLLVHALQNPYSAQTKHSSDNSIGNALSAFSPFR